MPPILNLIKNNLSDAEKRILPRFPFSYLTFRDNSGENLRKMGELADELGFIMSTVHALVMPLERVMSYKEGEPDTQTIQLEENLLVTIDEGIEASQNVELVDGCPFKHNQMNINSNFSCKSSYC